MKLPTMFDMVCRQIMTYMDMMPIRLPLEWSFVMAVMLTFGKHIPVLRGIMRIYVKLRLESEKDIVSHKTLDPARKIDPENVLGKQGIKFQQF